VVKALGFKTKEVELPDFPYGSIVDIIIAGEAGSIFEDFIRSGKVDQLADPSQIAGLKANLEVSAVDYLRAMRVRTLVQEGFRKLYSDVDILLAPARLETAPNASEPLDGPPDSGARPSSRGLNGLIPAGNLAGLPALSLPCGFADGLPIAISLVGRPFSENSLLAAGSAFQNQTDWHRRKPPVGD
jgi:aspartyl-tRNA(Asn)/glutamyl-tRNA(Gln) amidotransferase subunit A